MKICILILLLFTACSRNPVTGKSELSLISEKQEISLGIQNYPLLEQAQGGPYVAHPSLETYVQKVGHKLAAVSDRPHLPYEFAILDNSVPNAWALPGGKIAIYRGLLVELQSEAELAAVLAHEIVHSAARHSAKQMERQLLLQSGLLGLEQILAGHTYQDLILGTSSAGAQLLTLKNSRNAELEADAYGIKYLAAAGYDPQAAVSIQEMFLHLRDNPKPFWLEGLLATHPPSEERLKANQKNASQYPPGGFIGKEEYQTNMAPLLQSRLAYEALDQGYEALSKGKAKTALRYAEEAISIEPKEAHFYNLAGKACLELQEFTRSLKYFETAVRLNSHYFDFFLNLGLLEYKEGLIDASKNHLEYSVSLFPTAEGHYTLGKIALQQGDQAAAERHFAIAAEADSEVGHQAARELFHLRNK